MTVPYYSDDQVTLYHGDCREITEWLTADVLVTDPPYGIKWSRGEWAKTKTPRSFARSPIANDHDTTARDVVLGQWGDRPALVFGSLNAPYPDGWRRMLVFGKASLTGLVGSRLPWRRDWEPIFVLGEWPEQTPSTSAIVQTCHKSAGGYNGYATQAGHPHAKPLDVMEALLAKCPPGVIADPFAGSGSTLVAARNLGRRAIGVEIEERYCEIAARRLSQGVLEVSP